MDARRDAIKDSKNKDSDVDPTPVENVERTGW